MSKIMLQPLGFWARVADALMVPLMYILAGTFREAPQRTHRWNNIVFKQDEDSHLERDKMVVFGATSETTPRILFGFLPLFHMPILGGWRDYVVLVPSEGEIRAWHIGWATEWARGVSKLPATGPVRVLLGKGNVSFFGIDAITGEQIIIQQIGSGSIGDRGAFSNTPLL